MTEIKIRESRKEDFDEIIKLFKQLWPGKEINQKELFIIFEKQRNSENYILLSAESQDGIIGFSSLAILDNFWQEGYVLYITTFVVDEKYRNRGIGKRLIQEIINIAKEKGCKKIELESSFHRVEAHKFYEKMGFEKRAYFFSKDVH